MTILTQYGMKSELDNITKMLRNASYSLPEDGFWYESNGMFVPNNICTIAADCIDMLSNEIDLLRDKLEYEKRSKSKKWF